MRIKQQNIWIGKSNRLKLVEFPWFFRVLDKNNNKKIQQSIITLGFKSGFWYLIISWKPVNQSLIRTCYEIETKTLSKNKIKINKWKSIKDANKLIRWWCRDFRARSEKGKSRTKHNTSRQTSSLKSIMKTILGLSIAKLSLILEVLIHFPNEGWLEKILMTILLCGLLQAQWFAETVGAMDRASFREHN